MIRNLLTAEAGAAPSTGPTYISSSSYININATATIAVPAGVQEGDLLVATIHMQAANLFLTAIPTGFVLLHSFSTGSSPCVYILVKVATATESGSYVFTTNSGGGNIICGVVQAYRNAAFVNVVGAYGSITNVTGAPSITPTYQGTLCYMVQCDYNNASITVPPANMTQQAAYYGSGVQASVFIFTRNDQPAEAVGNIPMTIASGGNPKGYFLQITNEPNILPTFVNSQTKQNTASGSLVISKPTGTTEGDIMLAIMAADVTSTVGWADTTFTEVADQGLNAPMLRVAWKLAGPSEPSSYTFNAGASTSILAGTILTFRYAAYDTVSSISASADPLQIRDIAIANSQSILLAAGAVGAASMTLGIPLGMTSRRLDSGTQGPSFRVCSQQAATTPTAGARQMSVGTTAGRGFTIVLKPTRSLV